MTNSKRSAVAVKSSFIEERLRCSGRCLVLDQTVGGSAGDVQVESGHLSLPPLVVSWCKCLRGRLLLSLLSSPPAAGPDQQRK